LNVNGHKLEDKSDICNAFNEYFVKLGDNLVKQLSDPGIITFNSSLPLPVKNGIFCYPADNSEISNLIILGQC